MNLTLLVLVRFHQLEHDAAQLDAVLERARLPKRGRHVTALYQSLQRLAPRVVFVLLP